MLMTMLTRGVDPERACSCRLALAEPGDANAKQADAILSVSALGTPAETWSWESSPRLSVGRPVGNPELVRETQTRLSLSVEPPFAAFYASALRPDRDQLKTGRSVALVHSQEAVIEAASEWCRKVNRRQGTRLTLHRISHYLSWRAASEPELDPVMVAAVRGQTDTTSATQAYYQHIDPGVLQSALDAFWRRVIEQARSELRVPEPPWLAADWPPTQLGLDSTGPGLGSKKVPTRDAVRRITAYLRKSLKGRPCTRLTGWEDLCRYHRAYTRYTLHYLLWATGARAVRKPISDLRLVDSRLGLVLLTDQSAADLYSARLVWVDADFLAHLGYYRAHLEARPTGRPPARRLRPGARPRLARPDPQHQPQPPDRPASVHHHPHRRAPPRCLASIHAKPCAAYSPPMSQPAASSPPAAATACKSPPGRAWSARSHRQTPSKQATASACEAVSRTRGQR